MSTPPEPVPLDDLIARLWAGGAEGRDHIAALLSAIETAAPLAFDQAHARRVARQLRLAPFQS